jgi:hypothetical protein
MERDALERQQRNIELENKLQEALDKVTSSDQSNRLEIGRLTQRHEESTQLLQRTILEMQKTIERSEQEDVAANLRAANVKIHELDIANRSLKTLAAALESRAEDAVGELKLMARTSANSLLNMTKTVLGLRRQTREITSARLFDMLRMISWKAAQDLVVDVQAMLRALTHRSTDEPRIKEASDLFLVRRTRSEADGVAATGGDAALGEIGKEWIDDDDELPPSEPDESLAKLEREIQRLMAQQRETLQRYHAMQNEAGELRRKRQQMLSSVKSAVGLLVRRTSNVGGRSLGGSVGAPNGADDTQLEEQSSMPFANESFSFASDAHSRSGAQQQRPPSSPLRRRQTTSGFCTSSAQF